MMSETYVKVAGNQVFTKVLGDGPDVVLCHGTPFSSLVWEPVVESLNQRRVYRWDMPGYGRSSAFEGQKVDLDSQAQVLAALVRDHWGVEQPLLVAHDIGGAVALRAHLFHGLDASGLILLDAVCMRPWGSPFYQLAQAHAEVFSALPSSMHEAILRVYLAGATVAPLEEVTLDALMAPWMSDGGQAAFYRQIEQVAFEHTDDIVSMLDRVRCPTKVLWGVDDLWLPVVNGRSLAKALNVELVEVPNAGHLVQCDQPSAIADAIRNFPTTVTEPEF